MANLFQKILLSKTQCKALDFIKENKDSVEYSKSEKFDEFGMLIGTKHTVRISTDKMLLQATLTKYKTVYPFRDSDVLYIFQCNQLFQSKCNRCALKTPVCEYSSFASTVYTKMLNHYVAKHGCPCK